MRTSVQILSLTLFTSCTAISQQGEFLDALPRVAPAPYVVFSDDFESGLGQWNQLSGTWATGTPAANGVALISPTSGTPATFSITTVNNIDLTNRANCQLQYDVQFNLSGTAGVYAQVLFAGSVVGEFKQTTGTGAISSSGLFGTRRAVLPAGTTGRLTILTSVATATVADIRIDNIAVTCNKTLRDSYSNILDDFSGGGTNWGLTLWTYSATGGYANSDRITNTNPNNGTTKLTNYLLNVNLQGRAGCTLQYYYAWTNCACVELYWNSILQRKECTFGSGTVTHYLTAYEGSATNQLGFGCAASCGSPLTTCTVDNITLNCQQ